MAMPCQAPDDNEARKAVFPHLKASNSRSFPQRNPPNIQKMARIPIRQASRLVALTVLGGAALTTTSASLSHRTAFAEAPAPDDEIPKKKPIYSSTPSASNPRQPTLPAPSSPPSSSAPSSPTPTDRLTTQVKHARLYLHSQTQTAETSFNNLLTWAFRKESNFTDTVASLAPGPETGEQLLPGLIYVLVATMAGSIVSRNRGILLRASVPVAVGVTAGWMLIPVTMRNTADLLWEYEKMVPGVSEAHERVGGVAREAWRSARLHTLAAGRWADETAGESRRKVEGWVEKGN